MQTGDLVRVSYCGQLFQQEVCNIMYYFVAAWTGNLTVEEVTEQLFLDWTDKLREIQTDDFRWTLARMTGVTDPTIYAEYIDPLGVTGVSAGTTAPPFVAANFRLNRSTNLTRSGYKRVGGIDEAVYENGLLVSGLFSDPDWLAVSDMFKDGHTASDYTLRPRIVGFGTPSDPNALRLNLVDNVELRPAVTTQNTRKYGVGS